jgi:hypothetical protein
MTAKSNKSKSQKSRRALSAPRPSRPEAELADAAAPPQEHSENTPMEEHSEIVRRAARTTRPGTGNEEDPPPTARGLGLTVTDKSLRPSVLRWKSWQVSDSFREYAERATRGEKLPRFEGSILADPSRMLPAPSPDQSETSRRRAYGIKKPKPRPTLMNPNSLVWNPWLWAASATVFAVGLFSFTLWYTTPRDEILWDTAALTPSLEPRQGAGERPAAERAPAPPPSASEPVLAAPSVSATPTPSAVRVAPPPSATARKVAAAPPPTAKPPAAMVAPPLAPAPSTGTTIEPTPTAVSSMAKTVPVDRSATEIENILDGLEGQPGNGPRTISAPTATYPAQPPAAAAPPPAAPAASGSDPLLVEAPSF